ncbi:MAG: DegT/DnrJ/EryC1/StrS aminotransferase family protein [Bacteroidales bacterium]|jgi:dTDP-4-amino-4,6-dideoxygalactose transaminase|nr:DegT/DnrJ/EryC1/StrS aminotransferase family protein [Bacteroidales bacterium]
MIPFSPPRMDDKIIAEVTDTLKSGWITTGPKTKRFEKQLANYAQVPAVLCTSAATTGLELILRWFGVQEGDEVIIPAYTYCATANVVLHCGAKPVMVDCLPDSFNLDPELVKKAITARTKAIIPVDIGGFPADYDALNAIINDTEIQKYFNPNTEEQRNLKRILLLSDAAHSLGAKYQGKSIGSLADITVFSFHAVKNLTTAEGGAIALSLPKPFDNEAIYKWLNILSLHGQSKDALAKTTGNWRYDVVCAGYKANMTDIQASIGLVELERYDSDTLVRRKHIVDAYHAAFCEDKRFEIPVTDTESKQSSYHLYQLQIKDISEGERDEIIQKIFKLDVSVNVHFQPLPLFSYYKNLGYKMQNYPHAWTHYSREISLPVYYDLTDAQVKTVISAVKQAVEKMIGND